MGQRVEVCRAGSIAHPQPFLTCGFEAGIVTLTLCTQGVCPLETEAAAVNGKSVIVWNGFIFRAAPVFLAVVPVFVVTRANAGLGLTEWAAEFLPKYKDINKDNIHEILQKEVGIVFTHVLEDAGVYKCTPEGREAFMRFIESL